MCTRLSNTAQTRLAEARKQVAIAGELVNEESRVARELAAIHDDIEHLIDKLDGSGPDVPDSDEDEDTSTKADARRPPSPGGLRGL